ncbi:hypothetical protein Sme01_62800 [Sphaerisporangium melleum]|uniref:PE-PGRS family protein n=1 Tax=Sphaerisporangium melleum TaxID=321316 RepID=A0A917R1E6_9ACTN|nr:PE-PGRS family protein [Sphaerisporangium melleum]GGK81793.1 hypothetical protein GCM10007964_25550 [Sphaerisporangium melleum]GII73804.1 hypothetical protein Sme01_62800 [Sphaerisporangium melleum]
MDVGEVWAFRDQPKAVGEQVYRVEVVRNGGPRKRGDLHVRFLDGEEAGLQEWVARGQLLAQWTDVEALLDDDRRWASVFECSREVRGSAEFEAAKLVIGHVRPKNRIRLRHAVADAGVMEIADLDDVTSWLDLDPKELRRQPLAFEDRFGTFVTAWPTTRQIARRVAEVLGSDILKKMIAQEEAMKTDRRGQRWYRDEKTDRELERLESIVGVLHEWCGSDDIDRYDELKALRAEVERLGELVQRATRELRQRKCHTIAATIESDLGIHATDFRGRYR